MIGACQDDGGGGVSVGGDPGAVDGEEDKEHHQQEDYHGAERGSGGEVTRVDGWVYHFVFLHPLHRALGGRERETHIHTHSHTIRANTCMLINTRKHTLTLPCRS